MHADLVAQHGKGLQDLSWTICVVSAIVCAVLEMAHLDCVISVLLQFFFQKTLKDSAFLVTSKSVRKEEEKNTLSSVLATTAWVLYNLKIPMEEHFQQLSLCCIKRCLKPLPPWYNILQSLVQTSAVVVYVTRNSYIYAMVLSSVSTVLS